MNKRNLRSRLRTQRRGWALTQRELAILLGGRSPTHIARIEAGKRVPSIEIALACQALFGIPPEVLFPNVYSEIEERLMERIYRFHEGQLQITSPSSARKRERTEEALKRAVRRSHPKDV
jgi:transcriptional regulator with XRE-family HTH domain